jgi:DNA-3-methyladenine glycosylase
MSRLPRSFYARPTPAVARDLLGRRLVRVLHPGLLAASADASHRSSAGSEGAQRLSGRIIEVEAYTGTEDAASHASRGRTARNAPMFGVPGHAYVYFIYGMHWMFNVVARENGPGAVLVRALVPEEGLEVMRAHRGGQPDRLLTNGPARLAQALAIDSALNGADLCTHAEIFIEWGVPVTDAAVARGPRVGVSGDEAARTRPWRFWIESAP